MFSNPKIAKKFSCKTCDYFTSNKRDFDKHTATDKHKMAILSTKNRKKSQKSQDELSCNFYEIDIKKTQKSQDGYSCGFCEKSYKDKSGLWRHKKKCEFWTKEDNYIITNNNQLAISFDKDDLIQYLMKENKEFKELLLDQNKMMANMCEKNNYLSMNNANINSHNQTFNLNVFLNEHCKDAMNIMDFVNSLKLDLSDLETVGQLGYVDGISNIIVKNLKALDVHKRPVHCSDSKREVIYIKDEDKWEKETESRSKLRKAIKTVAYKNINSIPAFREKYPDCGTSSSKKSDLYNKIIVESMGGSGNNDYEKEEKIIKQIAKATVIDKSMF
jgi:hypothetical protein